MWPNPQETAIWSHLLKKILNGKLYFLCSVTFSKSAMQTPGHCVKSVQNWGWESEWGHGLVYKYLLKVRLKTVDWYAECCTESVQS